MTNVKLTYDYTINSIKILREEIQQVNTKLALVLTVSGVLVNFGKDLSGYYIVTTCINYSYPCLTCYLFKLFAYVFMIVTIFMVLWGLYPISGGTIVLPQQLLNDEWNLASEDEYLQSLTEYLETDALLILAAARKKKTKRLRWAIVSLSIVVILLIFDEIIATSIPILGHFCSN